MKNKYLLVAVLSGMALMQVACGKKSDSVKTAASGNKESSINAEIPVNNEKNAEVANAPFGASGKYSRMIDGVDNDYTVYIDGNLWEEPSESPDDCVQFVYAKLKETDSRDSEVKLTCSGGRYEYISNIIKYMAPYPDEMKNKFGYKSFSSYEDVDFTVTEIEYEGGKGYICKHIVEKGSDTVRHSQVLLPMPGDSHYIELEVEETSRPGQTKDLPDFDAFVKDCIPEYGKDIVIIEKKG